MTRASMPHALLLIRCRILTHRSAPATEFLHLITTSQRRSPQCTRLLFRSDYATKSPTQKPRPNAPKQQNPPSSRPPSAQPFAKNGEEAAPPKAVIPKSPLAQQSAKHPPANSTFTGTQGAGPHVPASNKAVYPAQLLIYHAGTPLIVFVSTFKFAAVLIFVFCSFAIAPAYYLDPLEPSYMAAVAVVTGAIPMILNVFAVPSLITYVHLTLPSWARISSQRLHSYLQKLPPNAALDVTAVRWIWPRVSRFPVSELYIKKSSGATYRLKRAIPSEVYAGRKWYEWRPIKSYLVAGRSGKTRDDKAWGEVLSAVQRGWANDPRVVKHIV